MNEITTTPDQEPLFAAADAGVPLLMRRGDEEYYVVNAKQLDAFAAFIAPRIRSAPVVIPGFAMAGDAIRQLVPRDGIEPPTR